MQTILNFFRVSHKPSKIKWLLACAPLANAEGTPAAAPATTAAPGADDYKKAVEIVGQNRPEALKLYQKAAEAGNSNAMIDLAYLLSQDGKDTEAFKWDQKAAEAGNALGMSNLGFMYNKGKGVTQSDTEALKWYRKAAEAGSAAAMFNLGVNYEMGKLGLELNMTEAVKWYRKAAAAGDDDAKKRLMALGM